MVVIYGFSGIFDDMILLRVLDQFAFRYFSHVFPAESKPDLVAVATEAALRAVDEDEAWTYYNTISAAGGSSEYHNIATAAGIPHFCTY